MRRSFKNLVNQERSLFLLLTILNALPLFIFKFFPTLDGPAHLYNAQLISSLLVNPEGLEIFFTLNLEPVPNWTGHFVLALLGTFMPAFLAEKVLLLLYFFGLPYAFRRLVLQLNPKNVLISYFIFPFVYAYPFLLGFYNFSIALIFLLLAFGYYIKNGSRLSSSYKAKVILFLLLTATYFSHLIVFAVLLMLIGIHVLIEMLSRLYVKTESASIVIVKTAKKSFSVFLSAVLPLLLFTYYFLKRSSSGYQVFIEKSELIQDLFNLRPLIVYNTSYEKQYTQVIALVLFALLTITLLKRAMAYLQKMGEIKNKELDEKRLSHSPEPWVFLISSVIMLVLYFVLPNTNSSGGFISVRFALLFFLFLLLLLATQNFSKWLMRISVLIILVCSGILFSSYLHRLNSFSKLAADCYAAANTIEDKSTVLSIKYADPWMAQHFSNYLGADKPMVVLENYEAITGYFPVKWNDQLLPKSVNRDLKSNVPACAKNLNLLNNKELMIDYVFVFGELNMEEGDCFSDLKREVLNRYKLIYDNETCQVYRLKELK